MDYSLMGDIPKGISVSEVFSLEPAYLKAIINNRNKGGVLREAGLLFFRILLKIYSIIYYRVILVDWHDGWIPFGFFEAKRIIRKKRIDLIFLDMEPPSSSLIGLLLKMTVDKPLVVDYHDPWTTSFYASRNRGIRKRIAEYLEQRVLKAADKITAGKDIIISGIRDKFTNIESEKFLTVHSGYDPGDFSGLRKIKNKKFSVTYTGKISEKFYYSPESFLNALGELIKEKKIADNDIAVNFVGTVSSRYQGRFQNLIKKLNLGEVVTVTGNVDHRNCARYQINADVLLYIIESLDGSSISNQFSGALPSKLYEYFYAGNPILAIVPPGFEADIIKETKTGFIVEPNNVESVKIVLHEIYQRYKDKRLNINPDHTVIKQFSRKRVAEKLANTLDEII